jgi:hypothetical protein
MSAHPRGPRTSGVRLCVIGAGPRGLSVVERICANAAGGGRRIVIHLVDPHVGRGGRVWSVAQSPLLLMNTIASQVSMFTDDSVDCAGPVVPGPSLYDWARTLGTAEGYPDEVRAEADRLGPDSYPSRALYGHYLNWTLERLCATAPPGVSIVAHRHQAVALDDDHRQAGGSPRQTVTLDSGLRLAGLDAVVLAQGHADVAEDGEQRALRRVAADRGLTYLPRANPAEADLDGITGDDVVAIRGMGLNFFDYMALLTAGRGGRFRRDPGGELVYLPSGREPRLCAGSRRGVPYHARGENEKGAFGRHEAVFITESVISRLRARAADGRPAGFLREVWPLIAREVELVYYATLLRAEPGAASFAAEYAATDPGAVGALLDRFGVAPALRWDWARIASPHGGRRFGSPAEFRAWLLAHLRADHAGARGGNVSDPLKAALDVLRDLRNEIRLIVDHGGLTGSSYRDELQAWYTPLNAYLSIGPPASRIEEMIALVEAGVLDVLGPGMRLDTSGPRFRVHSPAVAGHTVEATVFIDARLPEFDLRETTDPLLAGLRERGGCTPYRIPDPAGDHETGGMAVSQRPYRLVDDRGTTHPRRFGYGVPTEGVHWVTAAGIRPGVNSVILSDADAIARSALAAAGVGTVGGLVARPA